MTNSNLSEEKTTTRQSKFERAAQNFKSSRFYKIYQFLVSSAAVSLVVSVIVFVYGQIREAHKTAVLVDNLHGISTNLLDVQNSVSTRYLGIFPDYLTEVNGLLAQMDSNDDVVIFEDVLYYGILSKPESFIKMNHMLLQHAAQGGCVTIAYYDINGRTFSRMLREQRINPQFFSQMEREIDSLRHKDARNLNYIKVCEKYFAKSKDLDYLSFSKNVDKYLKPLHGKYIIDTPLGRELEQMYEAMDSVKTSSFSKPKAEIGFQDYVNMYKGMSELLIEKYQSYGIELIPLDEYLTMTCWLVSGKAVLAFPSKYATDEIGFYSQDPAFGKYIQMMLQGVKGHY